MTQDIANFEFVEQQLKDLKKHFLGAGEVLENLANIQTKFEELAEIYQTYKKAISNLETKAITTIEQIKQAEKQAEDKLEQRLSQLEATNEFAETFNTRISTLQEELNSTCVELATRLGNQVSDINRKVNDINREFEERLANFPSMSADINHLQNQIERCQQDLMSLPSQIKSQSEASLRKLDKRVWMMHKMIIILGLICVGLLIIVLFRFR